MKAKLFLCFSAALLVAMLCGFTYEFQCDYPTGSESPTLLDEMIRTGTKYALQERLNVDHCFQQDTDSDCDDPNIGYHRKITFDDRYTAAETQPTPSTNQGILYIKEAAADDASVISELTWLDEGSYVKQLTAFDSTADVTCLKLEPKDFILADCNIVDDSTIEITAAGLLQLKAGDADETDPNGICKGHVALTKGFFCDDVTIDMDANEAGVGLSIKTPADNTDTDDVASPVMSWGSYSGSVDNSTPITVDTAITIRYLTIKTTNGGTGEVIGLVTDAGAVYWNPSGGGENEDLTIDGTEFTVIAGKAQVNDGGKTYYWTAWGVRP